MKTVTAYSTRDGLLFRNLGDAKTYIKKKKDKILGDMCRELQNRFLLSVSQAVQIVEFINNNQSVILELSHWENDHELLNNEGDAL